MVNEEVMKFILEKILEAWKKYPELRLGQLIGNVIEDHELYYIGDEEFADALIERYDQLLYFRGNKDTKDE